MAGPGVIASPAPAPLLGASELAQLKRRLCQAVLGFQNAIYCSEASSLAQVSALLYHAQT